MHHFFAEGYVLPNQIQIWWTCMIVLYPYITGIVAGAFIISSLYHVFHKEDLKPVARFAMLMALAFLLFAPTPLLAHLGHPERAFNIMFMPNVTSAMAGFGFIYLMYMLILVIEIWLLYREDIVFLSKNASTRVMRKVYWLLSLGVDDVSAEAKRLDHKIMMFLAAIGIPAACTLHGYVGFLFGSIKGNPWWATPLMPVIFLLSAVVSGIAMVLICYLAIQWVKKRPVDGACVQSLVEYLWYFLIVDVTLELLELINHAYMQNHDWEILKELLTQKLFFSLFVVQLGFGSFVPFVVLGALVIFRKRFSEKARSRLGFASAIILLVQVLAMRWNVVIGGQTFSKSLRGFLGFDIEFWGREGLLFTVVLFAMPFLALWVMSRVLPLWGPVSTFPKKYLRGGS